MSFYRKQMVMGNLQLLCRPCHSLKTNRETRKRLGLVDPTLTTGSEVLIPTVVLSTVNTVNNHRDPFLDGGTSPVQCE
jgi:ABC-type molybdenum transport system ATPase subunit/photorepair protein PhrA